MKSIQHQMGKLVEGAYGFLRDIIAKQLTRNMIPAIIEQSFFKFVT